MSLIAFHRGLIAAGIVFCLGYGLWELLGLGGAGGAPALGLLFMLLGLGLGYYLIRLNHFLGYDARGEGPDRGEG